MRRAIKQQFWAFENGLVGQLETGEDYDLKIGDNKMCERVLYIDLSKWAKNVKLCPVRMVTKG